MSAHTIDAIKKRPETNDRSGRALRLGLFALLLICEAAIFIFGSYYFEVFPTTKNLTYNLAVSTLFLVAALWFKSDKRRNPDWRIVFALFVASVAYPITALFEDGINAIVRWFAVTANTSQDLALGKLGEMVLKTVPILVLVKLSGADLGSIYLKRGDLKWAVGIGLLVFAFLAPAAFMFAAQRFTSEETLGAAVGWGLVFSFANSFMEELWLRGLFFTHFKPRLGMHGSVWLTSIIFALLHGFAFYFMPLALPFFVLNTLALGLGCGYVMMKSDNLWGAVLIHAASDFFLFVAVLANA